LTVLAHAGHAAHADFWRWQPHPEVWVLVGALVGLYVYAARVVGPKVVPAGEPVLRHSQVLWFTGAIAVLWLASDWPVHDVAEEYLYSAHMVQHLLLTLVMPPMFLLATPRWLADLVLGQGAVRRWVRRLAHPVVAGVVFNAMVLLVHWPAVVNQSSTNGTLHYGLHVGIVTAALLMWTPVCGPVKEWRISLPAQMIYLFLMSVVPTVPGAWLTFAENAVYRAYDIPARLWGVSVQSDQQAAGLIMKLAGGTYLWTIITALFFRWAAQLQAFQPGPTPARPAPAPPADDGEVLTWAQVEDELRRLGPAPKG
jgi:putative membrane protein